MDQLRRPVFLCLASLLAFITAGPCSMSSARDRKVTVDEALQKPYLELFEFAQQPRYTRAEIDTVRDGLKDAQEICVRGFKEKAAQYGKEIEKAQKQLKDNSVRITESQRHELHCRIQNLRILQSQADMLAKRAIPIAYDNRKAKLDLIEEWPAKYKELTKQLQDGTFRSRHWGDVQDIGFREIEKDQDKDIKTGQDAIREMKTSGLMPKEIENRQVVDYVTRIARTVGMHSDLKVPLQVTVLDSTEINAFALPGGFLFVERGLLEAIDDESELAGVISHELSHVVARHGHKLMAKAQIADMLFQAAQIASVLFTGGVGMYYALQYGFYGLGFVLDTREGAPEFAGSGARMLRSGQTRLRTRTSGRNDMWAGRLKVEQAVNGIQR